MVDLDKVFGDLYTDEPFSDKSAEEQMNAYMDAASKVPNVQITWWDNPETFSKTIETSVYHHGHVTSVSYTINHEVLDDMMMDPKSYYASHIAGEIAQEIALKHPLDYPSEHCVYLELFGIFNNGSKASVYADLDPGKEFASDHAGDFSTLATQLPAVKQEVSHPGHCEFGYRPEDTLMHMVIHLNDKHKWSREKIADWIDDLHDSGIIDAEFHIETEVEE